MQDRRTFFKIFVFGLLSLVFCLLMISCSPGDRKTFVISGTYLTITSSDERAAKIVYNEFKRLDDIFNLYNPDSEISRLNNSYSEPVKVSDELIELFELSRQVYTLSNGSFDVTKGRLYRFWKELIAKKKVSDFPSTEQVSSLLELSGFDSVQIDKGSRTVTIKKKGLNLDFSAIAKGYMVDKAVSKLRQAGITSAIVDAGGDIYCLGHNSQKAWVVGIKEPVLRDGIINTIDIVDEAVATSGGYEQFFEYKSKKYSHLINPKTGFPVDNNIVSVTVVTKNCTSADGLATAFFILGIDGIKKFLAKHSSSLKIFVVSLKDGKRQIYIF